MGLLKILSVIMVLLLSCFACKTGIEIYSNVSEISLSGVNGSGTLADPYRVAKGTSVTFNVASAGTGLLDIVWSAGGVAGVATTSQNKAILTDIASDCGSFSGNTYTTPAALSGNGLCKVDACDSFDTGNCATAYVRVMTSDTLSFASTAVYSPDAGYSTQGGAVVSSEGVLNLIVEKYNTSISNQERLLGSYSSDLSYLIDPLIILVPPSSEVQTYTDAIQQARGGRFYIDTEGRCYIIFTVANDDADAHYPEFLESDDCSTWKGPFPFSDYRSPLPLSFGVLVDLKVDSGGTVHVAWADPRYHATGETIENADVFYDTCVRDEDGNYTCGTDVCLTECDPDQNPGVRLDVNIELYEGGGSTRVNVFWDSGGGNNIYTSYKTTGSFTEPANISTGMKIDSGMDSSGRLYVVHTADAFTTKMLRSIDGGASFIDLDITPFGPPDYGNHPSVYVDTSGNIHVATVAEDSVPDHRVAYFRSTDRGDSWTTTLTDNVAYFSNDAYVNITGDGSDLYIAYIILDGTMVQLISSTDGGSTWNDGYMAATSSSNSYSFETTGAAFATASGAYVVIANIGSCETPPCYPDQLFYNFCTTAECDQSAPELYRRYNVGTTQTTYDETAPLLLNIGDNSYGILWSDYRNEGIYNIYYGSGTFGENPSGSGNRVSNSSTGHDLLKDAVVADGVIHALWLRLDNNLSDIIGKLYYAKSEDQGATWETPLRLNESSINLGEIPSKMTVGKSGKIYVSWSDSTTFHLYLCEVTDSGCSTTDITTATGATDFRLFNDVASSSDGVLYFIYLSFLIDGEGAVVVDGLYAMTISADGEYGEPVKVADGYIETFGDDNEAYTRYANLSIDAEDHITATWVKLNGGNYAIAANGIYWSRSMDSGATWSEPALVTDAVPSGQGSAVVIGQVSVDENGRVYVLYDSGLGTALSEVQTGAYIAIGQ